jgi:UDP-N-acetylglucosamine:LPS N-acetylglucosamine transferase
MANPKILIAISEAGGGHRSVAESLKDALIETSQSDINIEIIDMLLATQIPVIQQVPDIYSQLTRKYLFFYNLLFQLTKSKYAVSLVINTFYLLIKQSLIDILESKNPDLVLVVNPILCYFFTKARRDLQMHFQIVVIVTDIATVHRLWVDPEVDLCIVTSEEACTQAIQLGVPSEKIVVTDFPIHPKFIQYSKTRIDSRTTLGLDSDRFTILITGGVAGSGHIEQYAKQINKTFPEHQLMIVAGKNQEAYDELLHKLHGKNFRVYGYVENMEELVASSDIVITKAGPSTIMECLAMGRYVIVTHAVGDQEQGNLPYILKHTDGLCSYQPSVSEIVNTISDLSKMDAEQHPRSGVRGKGAYQIAKLLRQEYFSNSDSN